MSRVLGVALPLVSRSFPAARARRAPRPGMPMHFFAVAVVVRAHAWASTTLCWSNLFLLALAVSLSLFLLESWTRPPPLVKFSATAFFATDFPVGKRGMPCASSRRLAHEGRPMVRMRARDKREKRQGAFLGQNKKETKRKEGLKKDRHSPGCAPSATTREPRGRAPPCGKDPWSICVPA